MSDARTRWAVGRGRPAAAAMSFRRRPSPSALARIRSRANARAVPPVESEISFIGKFTGVNLVKFRTTEFLSYHVLDFEICLAFLTTILNVTRRDREPGDCVHAA